MKKKKILSLVVTMTGIALLFASAGWTNVPAPPVNQTLGFDDTEFNALTEAECRVCHDSGVPDRHHMLYGSAIPVGVCSSINGTCDVSGDPCEQLSDCTNPSDTACNDGTPGPCLKDADCAQPLDACFITGDPCPDPPTDPCPASYTGQTCGQPICYGESAVVDSDADGDSAPDSLYGCLNCHEEDNTGGVISFVVIRDCLQCHEAGLNQPTVHHKEGGTAQSGDCVTCHGDVVDNPGGCKELCCAASYGPNAGQCMGPCATDADCGGGELCVALGAEAPCDDGHAIPTYDPSLVTPEPSAHEHICETGLTPCTDDTDCTQGQCDFTGVPCHEDGDCTLPDTVCIGGDVCVEGDALAGSCVYCHDAGTDTVSGVEVVDNHDTHHHTGVYKTSIGGSQRDKCAWCHKAGNPHNTGGHDSDRIRFCENCHGYESLHNIAADSDDAGTDITVGGENPGYSHIGTASGPDGDCWGCHGFSIASEGITGSGVPSIGSVAPQSLTAGTPNVVTVTGAALTTAVPASASNVRLTAADGTSVTIAPDSISTNSLTVTINAAAGNYSLQAVKDGEASNAVGISITPEVVITDINCSEGILTISGSGFGDAPPEGADEYINVKLGGVSVDIISWTDTEITASVSNCIGATTVNALYGSASTCDCEGNFDSDSDVDGSDAQMFKTDFGRSMFNNPCASGGICNGDFDCDQDVDGADAAKFKEDFGRSSFNNSCPACAVEEWCSYL